MGTTSEKLTYLNDTKQLLKENINNLGGNLTNEPFRQYASVLEGIYESLPKVSGIGASLSLSPSMVGKIKLNEIQGNTLQNGTPTPSSPVPIQSVTGLQNVEVCGKNLLSNLLQNTITYSGTTSTINGDTWTIIKSGTGGISLNPRTEYLPLTIKTGEKVTFSTFPYSGTMTSATVHIQIRVYFYDKDKNLITNMGSGTTSQDSETTILSSTYTATQDVAYIRLGDYIASGTGTTTGLVLKMQLERGDTRTDFESYKGNTYEVNLGKNLFDKDNANVLNNIYLDRDNSKLLTFNGTATFYIPCEPNTSYTISKSTITSRFRAGYTSELPANNVSVSNFIQNDTGKSITLPSSATAKYLCVFFYNSVVDTLTPQQILDIIQIEKGTQATSYSPYFTPIELNKISTYEDYIFKNEPNNPKYDSNLTLNSYYEHYENKKIVFKGSNDENWNMPNSSTLPNLFQIQVSEDFTNCNNTTGTALCNYFKQGTTNTVRTTNGFVCFVQSGNSYLRVCNTNITSVVDLKTWLSTNNLELLFPLATPTTTEITNTTLIEQLETLYNAKSKNGTTNITITSQDLPMLMDVSVIKGE